MALSGTIKGTKTGYFGVEIDWSGTQSIANNQTIITAKVYITYYTINISSRTVTCTIGGVKQTKSVAAINKQSASSTTRKLVGTFTQAVNHNSVGEASCTISASFPFKLTQTSTGNYIGTLSASKTVTLDTIPRASSITSASNVTLGNKCSINWTPLASSFAYKLEFVCGDVSYTTDYISPNTTSAYTYTGYTMSVSTWAEAMPKAYSGTCTVTLYTYTSSTSSSAIGSSSTTFTLTLPSTTKPTVSFANPTLVNGWNGYYIQGKSKCTLSATFTAGTGSSISSCSITGTGLSKTGTGTSLYGTTSVLTTSGTITYTAKVADGRASASTTKSIYVYPYADPTLSLSAARTSTSGSVKITYKASCSSVNSKNSLVTLKIYQKLSTASTWPSSVTKTVTLSSTSVSSSVTLTGFSTTDSYDFKAVVTDTYGSSSAEATASVSSEFRLLNINKNKKGLALGKMSEDNTFDCNLPMKITNTTTVQSDASLHINSADDKSFIVTRTGMINDIDQDGVDESVAIRGQLYVNDVGNVTLLRRYSEDGTNYTSQGYLQLQKDKVYVSTTFQAPCGRFVSTSDASGGAQNDVALRVGSSSGEHIDIDNNEIIAKDSATTAGTLALSGANVNLYVGETLTLSVRSDETSENIRSEPTYSRTYDASPNMYITSNGVFGRGTSSSQRYKTDIANVADEKLNPYNVLNIPVRQFKYNEDNVPINKNKDDLYIGFIAEEVASAYPIAAEYNENGQVEMWNIKVVVPAMLKIIQDQQKEIESLKNAINDIVGTSSKNVE